jgi:hypothetical protein
MGEIKPIWLEKDQYGLKKTNIFIKKSRFNSGSTILIKKTFFFATPLKKTGVVFAVRL